MHKKIKKEFTLISPNGNRPFLADITLNTSESPLPIILFVHGFKGFKDWGHWDLMANHFANAGFAFLKFNFSHNGTTVDDPLNFGDLEAFGNNNYTKELKDIDKMLEFINSQPLDEVQLNTKEICLIGHSRGGGVSLIKASEDERIKAVAAWAPLNNFKMGFRDDLEKLWKKNGVHFIENTRTNQKMPLYYQLFEDIEANRERYDPRNAVKQLDKPGLIIHGDNDETVPVQQAYELKDINPKLALEIIENGNHVFGGTHPFNVDELHPHAYEVMNKTVSFFKNL